jgi:hypothetical protein
MSKQPTREEAFDALLDYASRAELERIDALTPAEVAAERAAFAAEKAAAKTEAAPAPAAPVKPAPASNVVPFVRKPGPRARFTVLLVAATITTLAAMTAAVTIGRNDKPTPPSPPAPKLVPEPSRPLPSEPPGNALVNRAAVQKLFEEAKAEYAHHHGRECVIALDKARALDPTATAPDNLTRDCENLSMREDMVKGP